MTALAGSRGRDIGFMNDQPERVVIGGTMPQVVVDHQMITYLDSSTKREFLWQDIAKIEYGHTGGELRIYGAQPSTPTVYIVFHDGKGGGFSIPGSGWPWWGWRRSLRRAFQQFAPDDVEIEL
jgi:hypothetical protein